MDDIISALEEILWEKKDLVGKRILVTAGPTNETIDPVRFISNRSSGKMGYAIAKACAIRGATVDLVTGPTSIDPRKVLIYTRWNLRRRCIILQLDSTVIQI